MFAQALSSLIHSPGSWFSLRSSLPNEAELGMKNCCCHVLLLLSRFSRVHSVRPHRWQPTRLPHPWDSPGKNTGVGCHFLLQCMKGKSEREVVQSCLTLRPPGLQPTRLLHPWDFPGKSTGVGCHCDIFYNYTLTNSA